MSHALTRCSTILTFHACASITTISFIISICPQETILDSMASDHAYESHAPLVGVGAFF